ncbi:MAG: AmmeMemoRadiSam system protein A [Verrucomicrobiae bacterium]|nr:AmmeMemoRadiSam system protein A [Verrucomicrobiae bacterium]
MILPPRPPNSRDREAGRILTHVARTAVAAALTGCPTQPPRPDPSAMAPSLLNPQPVFVTIRTRDGNLRGCIGTLRARCPDVVEETWRLAREAAFSDSRFSPVTLAEMPDLRFEVSVLQPLEPVSDLAILDPHRFGIVVSTEDGRRGALLPDVEGIDTVDRQLAIARRKGGIGAMEPARIQRFTVQKFSE